MSQSSCICVPEKLWAKPDLGPKRKGLDLRLSYDIIILNTKLRDIWIGSCGTHKESNTEGVGFFCFESRCDWDFGVGSWDKPI